MQECVRLQRKPAATAEREQVPAAVQAALQSGGQPLDQPTRAHMEPQFGHDFSQVRVHADDQAAVSADAVQAQAYTAGNALVFGAGMYQPATETGQRLIAHELTHVVQQQTGQTAALRSLGGDSSSRQALEHDADATADQIVSGTAAARSNALAAAAPASSVIQLQQLDGGMSVPDDDALSTTLEEPPAPRTVVTDYGIFLVYPDNVSLLPSEYLDTEWAITETAFARLEIAMEAIANGMADIEIDGDEAFKLAVNMDLAWLMTQSVGQELVDAIVGSGKKLKIEATTGGNETAYEPNDDSYERPDGSPGPGADVTIGYNTQEWNPYGGDEPWMIRPPAIGLAHEMVHAWSGMTGVRALGETDGVRRRELQATGLGEFANAAFSENRFRAAFGMPLRPEY